MEEVGQLKYPMTSSGIEPTTFRFVGEFLNELVCCILVKKFHGP
jgi:hypothetical protein